MKSTQASQLAQRSSRDAKAEMEAKLRGMLLIRLLFSAIVFLLGPICFRACAPTLYLFTGALFALTLLYALLLKRGFDPKLCANTQIFADVLLVTSLIVLTGWENSQFGFLYIIPITTASLFFHSRETISIAVLSSLLYAAVVLFHRYRLSPATRGDALELLYILYIRSIIFCVVGYLCGHLAGMLKEQTEELRDLRSLHDLILCNMRSGLITTDTRNDIIYANKAAEHILGVPLAKLYNRNLRAFFVAGNNGALEQVLDNAMATAADRGEPKWELQARTANGIRIPIGFNLSAISNGSGEPVGKVMVFSDLTEVKELERRLRAIEKFRTAGELAAGIAHEIRNPLTSITGSIEMLVESEELCGANKELLSVVFKESARLNRIIEDFLAYAKRGSLDMKREDLREIVGESMEMLVRDRTLSPDVHMELDTPPEPAVVSADRSQMSQVFLNLLTNAVDAVNGSGTVGVRVESPMGNGDSYSVTVADTGPGIPPEELNRMFEPFFTTKKNGVGIGLCIAERIVREHNGRIHVVSERGSGTAVTVVLPRRQMAVEKCLHSPLPLPHLSSAQAGAFTRE
jgi:two-component system sensor histidine kinase PilS (NtrC family)